MRRLIRVHPLAYMAPSSSLSCLWKYDVFLSFRGEDTRKSFVSHLYRELDRAGISTFKDDLKLEKGQCISPELLKAIEDSRFSIVVISANYASSGWCLDELVKIIDCMEKNRQTVIPIFYQVDPSDVRKQTGNFEAIFKKYEDKFEDGLEKVQKWKKTLTKVANIAGEDSRNWMEDSKLIQKIVRDIFDKLKLILPSDFTDLVGVGAHVEAMDRLLCMGSSDEVRVIGICGIGGVGKTTLARFFFRRLSCQFQAHCFVENVKEIYKTGGLEHLLERFLSTTLRIEDLKLPNSEVGSDMMRKRLRQLKVLVVLDDVDGFDQLDALVNNTKWFCPGSRIIITTRDKHLLVSHGVELVYDVKCLSHGDALQLFNQFAFKEEHAERTFAQLSVRAVNCASGLPLALKVMGSFLCGRSEEEWESALHRLERVPHKDIMDVLRASYDGLDEEEKDIFLHVACIFRGESVHHIVSLLDSCGFSTKIGIQVLAGKSLLEISSDGYIYMHNLLQQMGRELVRQQSTNDPGKRKFLWDARDICDMLTDNTGTEAVEGISLDMSETTELVFESYNAFERMPNLKFLKIDGPVGRSMHLPAGLNCLPRKLRLLHWKTCPLKSLPLRYRPECLVELSLPFSSLKKLWEGTQPLANLREMDVHNSQHLIEIPDLSKATNLEILDLSRCKSLVEVPLSIQGLNKLSSLYLTGCAKLECLPSNINSESLKLLHLYGCSSLKRFPETRQNIIDLGVRDSGIEDLPQSFGRLSCIVELNMSGCTRLRCLPSTIGYMTSLEILRFWNCKLLGNLPDTIQNLKYLKILEVLCSPRMTEFPHVAESIEKITLIRTAITEIPSWIENLSKLRCLDFSKSKGLGTVPTSIFKLKSLRALNLSGCLNLESLPGEICDTTSCLSKLQELDVSGSKELRSLPSGILKLISLKRINLSGCSNLESLPAEISQSSGNLIRLDLSGTCIKSLPASFKYLTALSVIYAKNTAIEHVPPSSLNSLKVLKLGRHSYKLDGVPFQCPPLSSFSALEDLSLKNLNMPEIPDDLGHLCHLKELDVSGNDFETIPASIKNVVNLQVLDVGNCQKLQSLPELPGGLGLLLADGCISLEKASPAFKNHIGFSLLTNCFELDEDVEQIVCHMASTQGFEKSLSTTFLPGSRIPGYFDCTAKGSSLSIHLPPAKHSPEDFSSCTHGGLHGPCDKAKSFEIQSDHLFIINYHERELGARMNKEAAFNEVSFEFHLQSSTGEPLPFLKVKECGVSLNFIEDVEEESEGFILLAGPSDDSTEELMSIEKHSTEGSEEAHVKTRVIKANTANAKRCFEVVHGERLIIDEEEEEPDSKRVKTSAPSTNCQLGSTECVPTLKD